MLFYVISGRWEGDNERDTFTIEKIPPSPGLEHRTARSAGQHLLTY